MTKKCFRFGTDERTPPLISSLHRSLSDIASLASVSSAHYTDNSNPSDVPSFFFPLSQLFMRLFTFVFYASELWNRHRVKQRRLSRSVQRTRANNKERQKKRAGQVAFMVHTA
jgi:hypothetical protein